LIQEYPLIRSRIIQIQDIVEPVRDLYIQWSFAFRRPLLCETSLEIPFLTAHKRVKCTDPIFSYPQRHNSVIHQHADARLSPTIAFPSQIRTQTGQGVTQTKILWPSVVGSRRRGCVHDTQHSINGNHRIVVGEIGVNCAVKWERGGGRVQRPVCLCDVLHGLIGSVDRALLI